LQAQISLCIVVISWHDAPDVKDTETFAVLTQAFAITPMQNLVICFNNCKNIDKAKAKAFLSEVATQSNLQPKLNIDQINDN
jgi:selenocysteine-specific translation elongation factor